MNTWSSMDLRGSKINVDINSLSPEELRLLRLYGRLPSQSDHFARHLKERKYFDSGDYALSKAGKGNSVDVGAVGSLHPAPQTIPRPQSLGKPRANGVSVYHGGLHDLRAGSP
ncbi:camp-regulated phosphoprotein/endosulfine conserved region-domain-containing protein [Diplogelasinospora grovesii]|uniref:mRNA stability protein n=1 Tax=Diplogelasinospora grovesii TaxID=303347 RepID=A0AAN6MZ70_9PEZI|nr:camp-regulated phosphoprotein/endosulfine conserved region-domain-containing protein [Diplogelasinospora grovesii]